MEAKVSWSLLTDSISDAAAAGPRGMVGMDDEVRRAVEGGVWRTRLLCGAAAAGVADLTAQPAGR